MVIDDNLLHVNVYLKPPKMGVFLSQFPHGKSFFSVKVRFFLLKKKEIWKMLGNYSFIL